MGKIIDKDTLSIYLTRPEHIQLATIKTKLRLSQSETVVLALQILESLPPWKLEEHLGDDGKPRRLTEYAVTSK